MLPIIETPTIQLIVEECALAGIQEVVLVTSEDKTAIIQHFMPDTNLEKILIARGKIELAEKLRRLSHLCQITSVHQPEPLGLGHAIACAQAAIKNDAFAVCLGDEIFPFWDPQKPPALVALANAFHNLEKPLVGVVKIPLSDSHRYGMVNLDGRAIGAEPILVSGTVEKPSSDKAPSPYAIIGRYIFTPELFEQLSRVGPGSGGEIQLTDAMDHLAKEHKLYAIEISGVRYDMGNPHYFVKAQIDAALRRPELSKTLLPYLKTLCG